MAGFAQNLADEGNFATYMMLLMVSLQEWRPSLLGWRPSLLGWRPLSIQYHNLMLLPATVSKQLSLLLNQAFTNQSKKIHCYW